VRTAAGHVNAVTQVAGDDVPRAGRCAADGVVAGREDNEHSGAGVWQRGRARGASADVIAEDRVAARSGPSDGNAVIAIACDDVPRRQRGTADDAPGRPTLNDDAVEE